MSQTPEDLDYAEQSPEMVRDGDVLWKENAAAAGEGDDEDDDFSDLIGFDLSSSETIDRSGLRALINSVIAPSRRLPLLEVVFDRAAREISASLRQLTNENVEVTLDDTSATRFGEFLTSITTPSVIGVLRSDELDNYCLIAFDTELVYSLIDLLLGGQRAQEPMAIGDRPFSKIELTLIERVMRGMCRDLSSAYSAVADINFTLDRYETTPRFAAIAQDGSVSSLSKLRVDMDGRGGRIAILTPHATLEPIMKSLIREFITDTPGSGTTWRDHLKNEIGAAQIDLQAVIAEKQLLIEDIEALEPGAVLRFGAANASEAEFRASGVKVASGKVGRQGNTIAVRLGDMAASENAWGPLADGEEGRQR